MSEAGADLGPGTLDRAPRSQGRADPGIRSVRTRIALLLLLIMSAIVAMTSTVLIVLSSASEALQRVEDAHRQYQSTVYLAEQANAYSEQIAETLLLGASEREDYVRARERVAQGFARLRSDIEAHAAQLPPGPARDREDADLVQWRAMRGLYRDLEVAAERTFGLMAQGRRDEALALFQSQIEDGLDLRLQRAIAGAGVREAEELAEADLDFAALRERLLVLALLVGLATLGLSAWWGWSLFVAVARPIRALTEGAGILGAGRLEHRIPRLRDGEFASLAARFNVMAEELSRQRDGLVQTSRELERQVRERTAELEAANRRLTELDQQRVAFLADISHELRTPLTALRSEAEIALRGQGRSEAVYRDSLTRIAGQAVEMGRLVEDLLFIARSESGQLRFDPQRLSLRDVVEQAATAAETFAGARGVDLSVRTGEAVQVMGDPRRLAQTLTILLDNAVRYSEPGGRVEVFVRAANDLAEVLVRDWGVGVDPEDLPFLFDRFYRGRRSADLNPGGAGLGLPIARWIARRHGGEVELHDRGDGADAVLRLPLAGRAAA